MIKLLFRKKLGIAYGSYNPNTDTLIVYSKTVEGICNVLEHEYFCHVIPCKFGEYEAHHTIDKFLELLRERNSLFLKQLGEELLIIEDLEEKHEEIPKEKVCPICECPLEFEWCPCCNLDKDEIELKSLYGYTEEIEEF